jgi:DNA processing protein
MIIDARAEAWVSLYARAVPARALVELLRAFGDPVALLAATPAARQRAAPAAAAKFAAATLDAALRERTQTWLAAPGHDLVAWDDVDYPPALLELGDPPPVLFCLGRRELLTRPAFAIIGSRNASPQGAADAEAFAGALSAAGLTIVSGLALGIDAAAHRGGLAHAGSSIAVVGTGLDRVYPAGNRDLAHALAERGAVVSEFAPGTPPLRANFPRRNRLVSGLARGVLVVEATLASGSLITARLAGEQGRDVFAMPGSIHSPLSKGCHRLIRDGAKLVETAQDILDELRLPAPAVAPAAAAGAPVDPAEAAVLAAIGHAPAGVDTIAARTGLRAEAIAAALLGLELAGRVAPLPGAVWQRRA